MYGFYLQGSLYSDVVLNTGLTVSKNLGVLNLHFGINMKSYFIFLLLFFLFNVHVKN